MAVESEDERIRREAAAWLTRLNARVVDTGALEDFFVEQVSKQGESEGRRL